MSNADNFVTRLPKGAPEHLRLDIPTAFGCQTTAIEIISAVRSNSRLSRERQDIEIGAKLTAGPLAHLAQLRKRAEEGRASAMNQRKVLRDRVLNSDALPETRKQEVRQWFRGLPTPEKMEWLRSGDEQILEAVLGARYYLTGLPKEVWDATVDSAVTARFGDALNQIGVLEKSYDEAIAAMQVVENAIVRESSITPRRAAE
ncbi:hypothetical protein [Methylocystis sp.]|uniref:hypothetical protein n=1 Tax=Methylocystis sp. TaxID=1911079 RepID=UPI003D0E320C